MSTNMDRTAVPRSSSPAPIRRVRRSNRPAVASLEDRKLMTGGFGMAMAPMNMMSYGPAEVAQLSTTAPDAGGPQLSFRGDFVHGGTAVATTPSADSTAALVDAGAAAQLGPYAGLIYSAGDRLSGPFAVKASTIATSTTGSASTDPSVDASDREKLDAAFTQLRNDMQSLRDNSEVTPKLLAALRTAQDGLATGATGTIDSDKLTTFQDDQKTIAESGTFTDDQQATLKSDYTAVLESAGVSDDAVAAYFAALDAVKAASHVTSGDLTTLANDQQAIQTLLDAQGPNSGSSPVLAQPSRPGQWTQGGNLGVGGFTMDGFGAGFATLGGQGGGHFMQTGPQQRGVSFGVAPQAVSTSLQGGVATQQATPVSIQVGGSDAAQQATAVVASQDASGDQQQQAAPTDVQQIGAGTQQTTLVNASQGGAGGRYRTLRTRTLQGGNAGGMTDRMTTMRFGGPAQFGGFNGGNISGRRF